MKSTVLIEFPIYYKNDFSKDKFNICKYIQVVLYDEFGLDYRLYLFDEKEKSFCFCEKPKVHPNLGNKLNNGFIRRTLLSYLELIRSSELSDDVFFDNKQVTNLIKTIDFVKLIGGKKC